jgi:hypothetical protein
MERFLEKTVANVDTGCIEWIAGKDAGGYARFYAGGRHVRAHRFAYEQFVGPIPEGYVIDHLCGNKGCVNYQHLEAVTNQENVRRHCAKQTSCRNGHPRTAENTKHRRGRLICLDCDRGHYRPTLRHNTGLAGSTSSERASEARRDT